MVACHRCTEKYQHESRASRPRKAHLTNAGPKHLANAKSQGLCIPLFRIALFRVVYSYRRTSIEVE